MTARHEPMTRGDDIGTKATNLEWLAAQGYRVPAFTVVTMQQCARILEPVSAAIAERLSGLDAHDRASLRDTSSRIRELITTLSVPDDIAADIATSIEDFGARLAVRSSVEGEDSATDSFAGQLDTVLDVGHGDVGSAVLTVLASAYSERSLFYRARRGLDNSRPDAAVIVQQLVDSAAAGVAFSCNPTNRDTDEAVVTAGLGLGDGVVAGTVDCDTYFVDARSLAITTRVCRIDDGPALADERVAQIVRIAVELADRLGAPQDVEWALDTDGVLWLLQARPVTATGMRRTVFDNVNVAESYPGLSSPLTFSIVRLSYERVFRVCHRDFGASRKTVRRNTASLYPYLLGTFGGRIYYNISNWYSLFLQIPGMEFAISGWEAALGIENRYARPDPRQRGLARMKLLVMRARILVILVVGWLRLPRRLASFFDVLGTFTTDLDRRLSSDTPAREREPHELLLWLERCLVELVPAYSVQIFNDFLAQQLFHVMSSIIGRTGVDDVEAIRNELFCGEAGLHSVEPVRSALALAEDIRGDRALTELFTGDRPSDEVWAELGRFPHFEAACRRHIATYGDRTVDELKLETDPLYWHPERLVPILRNYARGGQNISDMLAHEQAIRRGAERSMSKALRGKPILHLAYLVVLRLAREHVKQRENMRLGRSRCFGLVKRVFREYGRHFHEAGLLDHPRDIFYLTFEEIAAITRGTFVDASPRTLVDARKADEKSWSDVQRPSRVETSGIVAAHVSEPEFGERDGADVLTGIGCSPGTVTAPVLVVTEPSSAPPIDGQVLVASTTDPGWVFLMVAAGGLVSEKGSLLSHTAIIGRELGITTVVGVKDAVRLLDGAAMVTVDGRAGTVTLTKAIP